MALAFIFLFLVPLSIVYGTWAWGVVIQKTWFWFVVPSFNLQPLTFHQAIAVSVFVALFFIKSNQKIDDDTKEGESPWGKLFKALFMILALPWVALLFNWITYGIFM